MYKISNEPVNNDPIPDPFMEWQHLTNPNGPYLVLRGELFVHEVETLQGALQTILDQDMPSLRLDLGEVTAIDTIALQTIVAFCHSADRQHKSIQFVEMSEVVRDAWDLTGLTSWFENV